MKAREIVDNSIFDKLDERDPILVEIGWHEHLTIVNHAERILTVDGVDFFCFIEENTNPPAGGYPPTTEQYFNEWCEKYNGNYLIRMFPIVNRRCVNVSNNTWYDRTSDDFYEKVVKNSTIRKVARKAASSTKEEDFDGVAKFIADNYSDSKKWTNTVEKAWADTVKWAKDKFEKEHWLLNIPTPDWRNSPYPFLKKN